VFDFADARLSRERILGGFRPQRLGNIQAEFFPILQVAQSDSAAASRIVSIEAFDQLAQARPWDDMWKNRVKRFYFHDPRLFDDNSITWILTVFQFMFDYRQAIWERLNWLHMPKIKNVPDADRDAWNIRLRNRHELSNRYLKAWKQLTTLMPRTIPRLYLETLWYEPAMWFCPGHHCVWVPHAAALTPDDDSTTEGPPPIIRESVRVMREQPIRSNWTIRTADFVTTMTGQIPARILAHYHAGASWSLPDPWRRADYPDVSNSSYGTPGPDFYTSFSGGARNSPWFGYPAPRIVRTPIAPTPAWYLKTLREFLFPRLPDQENTE
jgi:hypothetical protein